MKKIIVALMVFLSSVVYANPVVKGIHEADQSRFCEPESAAKETRLLRREIGYILETMGMEKDSIKVFIGRCSGYAVAATSLNTIIISPDIANLSRQERVYLLSHEIGHLANNDFKKWESVGVLFESAHYSGDNIDKIMSETSRKAELDADIFAAKVLIKMDMNVEAATTSYFMKMKLLHLPGTSSHPAAVDRIAAMVAFTE